LADGQPFLHFGFLRYIIFNLEIGMAKDLWQLRMERRLTVKQLAGKSGVPASKIYAYESGEPGRVADLVKLARALFVDASEIKVQSDPKPKEQKPQPKAQSEPSQRPSPPPVSSPKPTPETAPPSKKKQPAQKPARESQVTHLLGLASNMGIVEATVTEIIGKPLTALTEKEATHWLHQYTEEWKRFKADRAAEHDSESDRPPNTRRKRFHLPEGVDVFEFNYLTKRQEAGDLLAFKLFDGTEMNGRIIGFSPYDITIAQPDGVETTIHKLALAYYTVAQAEERAA
jgi:transcriptional regulator with XRE-family HTH domain